MQISATLVKGKARVQFGANKVRPNVCGAAGQGLGRAKLLCSEQLLRVFGGRSARAEVSVGVLWP